MDIKEMLKKYEEEREIVYKNIDERIIQIKSDKLTEEELIACLDSKQLYIISNAIIKIIQNKIDGEKLIQKLAFLEQYTEKRFVFTEGIAIGHFAVAALFIIGTKESIEEFERLYNEYNEYNKDKTKKAIEILLDLTK